MKIEILNTTKIIKKDALSEYLFLFKEIIKANARSKNPIINSNKSSLIFNKILRIEYSPKNRALVTYVALSENDKRYESGIEF
jgi:hypothetical protein